MSKVIFFNVPAHGHTNPTLGLVKELINRGEKVIYYSFPEFKEKIITTGAEYREYKYFPDIIDTSTLVQNFSSLYYALLYATSRIIDGLIDDVTAINPDYIIHDSLCPWGKYVAEICHIPAIASCSTFIFNSKAIDFQTIVKSISGIKFSTIKNYYLSRQFHKSFFKKYGINRENFFSTLVNTSQLNIIYTSKNFHPSGELFDEFSYKFIGPSIISREQDDDNIEYSSLKKPIIYISLGTISYNNFDFYKNCFQALNDFPGIIILSVGEKTNIEQLGLIPSNFIIRNHVNQVKILNYTDVFITHGGMNSVHEGLYYGVPLAVYPLQLEQESVAERVVEKGCGIRIKRITSSDIKNTVVSLLNNENYKKNSVKMGETFRNAGGYLKGADYIFEFKRVNNIK
jgi:MGT family glycosyltransferase